MITNASFQVAGTTPGSALAWTLRSSCAREAVAGFTPGDNAEGFERWAVWVGALGNAVVAPFLPNGTVESFDVWPNPLFALELTGGLVGATATETFESGWGVGTLELAWRTVHALIGAFVGGSPRELFAGWQPGAVYAFAFPAGSLRGAPFVAGPVEIFQGWTTPNTTLG